MIRIPDCDDTYFRTCGIFFVQDVDNVDKNGVAWVSWLRLRAAYPNHTVFIIIVTFLNKETNHMFWNAYPEILLQFAEILWLFSVVLQLAIPCHVVLNRMPHNMYCKLELHDLRTVVTIVVIHRPVTLHIFSCPRLSHNTSVPRCTDKYY